MDEKRREEIHKQIEMEKKKREEILLKRREEKSDNKKHNNRFSKIINTLAMIAIYTIIFIFYGLLVVATYLCYLLNTPKMIFVMMLVATICVGIIIIDALYFYIKENKEE